ncbi:MULTISPECIES: demethylmenaquinone methyltransferase [unclassified Actinomyces]|uniref:demethylmenaquinone methyltransferase n=1 Tax=unclassified Actinomyces TaxID=2609248 RepID=UPI0020175974|nr:MULTISPECIES: demethylmenaquinone methyltransferase [unclassified Actinomyces]MCL3776932.1 demethylmenaquinone methyltransferase [Actinomyces sp. AC-20-1]MCL3789169.1 demethylmenaquinone methyltransferase [Actinomyces sp. 187325]MCL3791948.1 demethylmenaquinone methyltransferase [Actinomyces sp. 186855]MCL3794565.1 demethylmenaquinone methyltransferase [Actinomyces sp. 217892]
MSRATLAKDPREVAGMFDAVARRYDLTNDVMSLWQVRMWRRATRAAVAARPGTRVLDLAAGTGTSSVEYADDGADVIACDFSTGMVAEGKARHPEIEFVAGDAMALPFADASFDIVTISYGLRNVQDTLAALSEMRRVTRPGGRVVIAEFSTPVHRPLREAYRFYLGSVLPAAGRLLSSNTDAYSYLGESILAWPDQRALAALMQEAGWREVAYKNLSGGIVAVHRATRPAA